VSDQEHGKFLQFPLSLFASPMPLEAILTSALEYGACAYMEKKLGYGLRHLATKQRAEAFQEMQNVIGFNGGNVDRFIEGHEAAVEHVHKWEAKHGASPQVRISSPWLFDAINRGLWTEREFRVLVGIYSCIGTKPYAKVGWPMARARAAGLKSPSLVSVVTEQERGPLYSRFQIARTVDELRARSVFARAVYKRGETFYSNKATPDQLWDMIAKRKLKKVQLGAADAARDVARTAQITEALKASLT
jgi:hypothetical protein